MEKVIEERLGSMERQAQALRYNKYSQEDMTDRASGLDAILEGCDFLLSLWRIPVKS